jgi:hypothetical protein
MVLSSHLSRFTLINLKWSFFVLAQLYSPSRQELSLICNVKIRSKHMYTTFLHIARSTDHALILLLKFLTHFKSFSYACSFLSQPFLHQRAPVPSSLLISLLLLPWWSQLVSWIWISPLCWWRLLRFLCKPGLLTNIQLPVSSQKSSRQELCAGHVGHLKLNISITDLWPQTNLLCPACRPPQYETPFF